MAVPGILSTLAFNRRLVAGFCAAFVLVATMAGTLPVNAQQPETEVLDPDAFGDIFTHPRDRSFLPGQAPSRATLQDTRKYEDGRGQVNRYEYNKGKTIISRETWTDERGESQGRIGLGLRF